MEHELEKQKMDSMKLLSDTNIKISEAKNVLFKLQETETEYLVLRENIAIDRIKKAVEESKNLVEEINKNHQQVKEFYLTVSDISLFLSGLYSNLSGLLEDFNARNELWEMEYKKQCIELATTKKDIQILNKNTENEIKSNQRLLSTIKDEKSKIESRQTQIKVALEILNKKQNG